MKCMGMEMNVKKDWKNKDTKYCVIPMEHIGISNEMGVPDLQHLMKRRM
jgi:hypothetical protein